jgi:hypothetical protein
MEKTLESFKFFKIKPDKVIVSLSPKYLNLNLENEKKKLEEKYPFLLCLVQKKITGIGENLNYTFNHVKTDYITIWGADDFFHPQYFEVLNTVIKKNDINIITHSWDSQLTIKTKKNPRLAFDINVFNKINLEEIKTYNEFYLKPESYDVFRFYSKKYENEYNTRQLLDMHYGFQTFKTFIIKENKYKTGPKFDWKSDSLFLVDAYKKYGNMVFIHENMVQYIPSETCK